MSSRETPLIHRYWKRVGGTLLQEFLVVSRRPGVGRRSVDAVIILDGDYRIASPEERLSLDEHDLIVVQAKANRLGMSLMGQALFSGELIKNHFTPRTIRNVALCAFDDTVLRPLAERYGIDIVVDDTAVPIGK